MTDEDDKSEDSKAEQTQNLEEARSIEEVREAIVDQPGPISFEIGTCPKPTFAWFKALAENQYADNYGLALTMLKEKLEAYEQNQQQIDNLRERISRLEEDIDSLIEALNEAEESPDRRTLNSTEENSTIGEE